MTLLRVYHWGRSRATYSNSSIPILAALPLHCDAGGIAHHDSGGRYCNIQWHWSGIDPSRDLLQCNIRPKIYGKTNGRGRRKLSTAARLEISNRDAKPQSLNDRITAFVKVFVLPLPPRSAVRLAGSSMAASAAASMLVAAWTNSRS